MSMNLSLGIFLLQLLNQGFQRRLLLGGSGILRLAILGKPADVAYSDAHGVVTLAWAPTSSTDLPTWMLPSR